MLHYLQFYLTLESFCLDSIDDVALASLMKLIPMFVPLVCICPLPGVLTKEKNAHADAFLIIDWRLT